MTSSLPTSRRSHLLVTVALSLISAFVADSSSVTPLTYHNGPIMSGDINLSLIWYGQVGRVQKAAVRSFLRSLNVGNGRGRTPQVANWWHMVESYQSAAKGGRRGMSPRMNVKVVRQIVDRSYSQGKVLIPDLIANLVTVALANTKFPNTIVVILSAKDVTPSTACSSGSCYVHGLDKFNRAFILVGNPETECPGVCGVPFHRADYGPAAPTFLPPSGNIGADALVMHLASALAASVSNPQNNGLYAGSEYHLVEAGSACDGMFASNNKVLVDPRNGGAYNALGWRGKKFLLPALWNPTTKSCWTPL